MKAGQVLGQFLESRVISLVKPGKIADHTIGVDNLRPITVLSCWHRIWTSAWVKQSLKGWMRRHVPAHFAVAHTTASGEVALDLLDSLIPFGPACLLHLGGDSSFVSIVTQVWQNQCRWISFGAHTHSVCTSCAPAIPQGGPLGPFMMTLWTWAGWCAVESVCSPSRSLLTRIYVDDRSFCSARCWDLMERFHAWCAWSFSVGLLENQSKTVVVASTPARRLTLRRVWPEHAVRDAELLGVCTMVATRGLTKKEKARVDACSRTVTLLSCVGLPFERYLMASRLFAVSKAA